MGMGRSISMEETTLVYSSNIQVMVKKQVNVFHIVYLS